MRMGLRDGFEVSASRASWGPGMDEKEDVLDI